MAVVLNTAQIATIRNWTKRTNQYEDGTTKEIDPYKASSYSKVSLKNCGILGIPYQFNMYSCKCANCSF